MSEMRSIAMSIKFDDQKNYYIVQVSARHPKTRKPRSLKRIGFKTLAEAKREEVKMRQLLFQKMHNSVSPLFSLFLKEYEAHVLSLDISQKTKEGRLYDINRYALPLLENVNVDKITEQMIHQILASSDFLEKKQSRQKDILKHIRHAFNFAWEKGYISKNPTPKKKFRVGKKLLAVLTEEEVKILLDQARNANHPWYFIWAVALYTGMRNGELYALRWSEVKLSTKQIAVVRSWTREGGFSDLTKSGNDRFVTISNSLLPILEELKLITGDTAFVLPRLNDWASGAQAAVLREFLGQLGLTSVRFHDLRATWATILLSKGIPYPMVMRLGGWEETSTMDRYLRKSGVSTKGATDVLDFDPKKPKS
jgi:integrase